MDNNALKETTATTDAIPVCVEQKGAEYKISTKRVINRIAVVMHCTPCQFL
jgi:hypothetical protein